MAELTSNGRALVGAGRGGSGGFFLFFSLFFFSLKPNGRACSSDST
jgi:hypothetical protein